MLDSAKVAALEFIESQLGDDVLERLDALEVHLGGRETDDFGFSPEHLKWVLPVAAFFYQRWFRAQSFGLDKLPEGPALFIANHSGQIPIDAAMIVTGLMLEADPPRAPRSMVERLVPSLPYLSVFFSRLGQVLGTPENCRHLLKEGYSVLAFPEGAGGISKTYDKAYNLQEFGHGFMRLALETKTPIVPVGLVGAEEQYPTFWNLDSVAKSLGLPAFPVILNAFIPIIGLLPLPVKYRIYFGTPLYFEGDPEEDESEIAIKVTQVKESIDGLLRRGLDEREGFFR